MQLFRLALGMLVVVGVALLGCATASPTGEEAQLEAAKLAAPKLFDFANYKQLFEKHYATLSEELARKKYFLARAFRAFIAAVKYRYHQLSYYLSVNHMSDYSPAELDMMRNRVLEAEGSRQVEVESDVIFEESRDSLAAILKLIEERANEPIFKELKQKLGRSEEHARRKRAIDEGSLELRDLPMDRLINTGAGVRDKRDLLGSLKRSKLSSQVEVTKWYGTDLEPASKEEAVRAMRAKDKDGVYADLRKTNCFSEVRHQGKCGSCYAFAVTSIMEWTYCMKTGQRGVDFSEQYMIDCGPGNVAGLEGCRGGSVHTGGNFVHSFGLELATNYPYKGRQNRCPYSGRNTKNLKTTGYIRGQLDVGYIVAEELLPLRVQFGPLALGIAPGPGFHEYGGGVHGQGCGQVDSHAVVLVGHGRENGLEYWLIRNSYGLNWGEQGYYKLARDANCIPDRAGYIYTASGKPNDFLKLELNKLYNEHQELIKRHERNA